MYTIRQEFLSNKKWIRYNELDKALQQTDAYHKLMSQPSQCTLQMVDRVWKSYFAAIKDWKKNPSKYLGMPKLPNYKDKNGRYPWLIKNNSCFIHNDQLKFKVKRLQGYDWKTHAQGRLICVRFIPKGCVYVMEVVTEIEIPDIEERDSKNIASFDLGVNNLVTLTNNIGLQPIIINGRGVKSINQYYNKQRAKLQSDLKLRNGKYKSHKLETLSYKRGQRIKNYIHNTSRYVVNYCLANGIDTLVCGLNKEWKQDIVFHKKVTQNFVQIPFDMLIRQLEYKCQVIGIKFFTIDESYTSGTSFLDGELPCMENYSKSRRKHRGQFLSGQGYINADVNGSLQILRKAFPDAFGEGIEGDLNPVVINATKVA
jgi:putative transposase